ncbi:MAG: HIRAN domain-containing protein [Tannerellaceae bacterium]|jgi:hypothetical protein|nr:HIRAN domain-containing protein [Tannerellaceae bacterium]
MEAIAIIFILLLVSAALWFWLWLSNQRSENETGNSQTFTQTAYSNSSRISSDNRATDGYKRFSIKGISHYGIKDSDLGYFSGYAEAETNNEYDQYAVAIYRNDGKQLGHAPANYMTLHESILDKGGKVPAWGVIEKSNEGYYGDVYIEFNPDYFHDKMPRCERVYKSPNLQRSDIKLHKEVQDNSFIGKFYGLGKLLENDGEIYPLQISNDKGVVLGIACINEYGYNTIHDFATNKEVEIWGYVGTKTFAENSIVEYFGHVYIPIRFSASKLEKTKNEFKDKKIRYRIK